MRIRAAMAWTLVAAMAGCAGPATRVATTSAPTPVSATALPPSLETARTGMAGHVYVHVVDREGTPVAGALVRAYHVENGAPQTRRPPQATDGLGRVVLELDEPGLYRICLEEAPGIAFGWLRRGVYAHSVRVSIDEAETVGHGVRIVAPRPGGVEIRVDRSDLSNDDRVSVTLRRRYPNGDLLSRHDSNTRPEPSFGVARRTESWLWEELPEGAYVARISVPEKRTARFVGVDVAAGAVTSVGVAPGPPGDPLVISYDGPREEGVRQHVWLNPMDGRPDLVRGSLHEAPHRSLGATPGRYVAILPRGGAAMVVDVPDVGPGEQIRVHLAPPAWTSPAAGGVTVTLRVLRDRERVGGVFFGLAPPASEHLRSGSWLRVGNTYKIENVSPGDWDVVVLNRVYTDFAGIPQPIIRRLRVAHEDVALNVRVSTE